MKELLEKIRRYAESSIYHPIDFNAYVVLDWIKEYDLSNLQTE